MTQLIANIIIIIFIPFIFIGLINKVKSFWAGRKGPSILQPLRDFIKLMKKGEVISTAASFIFRMAPSVSLASALTAAAVVPMAAGKSFFSFQGDFVFFAYVLATGRFFAIAGAMDTGSSFEGMGASREAVFSAMVEPAFFLIIGSLAFLGKAGSFSEIFSAAVSFTDICIIITMLCSIAFFIMLIAEGYRVPVDDPNTHLELTMIHEVMVLDNSGPDLGMILYASGLRMVVIGSIIANIILPSMPLVMAIAAYLAIIAVLAIIIGTVESLVARLRMSHVPEFIFFMSSIGMVALAVIILFASGGLK